MYIYIKSNTLFNATSYIPAWINFYSWLPLLLLWGCFWPRHLWNLHYTLLNCNNCVIERTTKSTTGIKEAYLRPMFCTILYTTNFKEIPLYLNVLFWHDTNWWKYKNTEYGKHWISWCVRIVAPVIFVC